MDQQQGEQTDYRALIRAWSQTVPWYQRVSARMGLQGKLVVSFMVLLVTALAAALWLYFGETRSVLRHVMGEHAIAVAHTLGMASERPLAKRDAPDLDRIARKVLKNPDIAAIGFYDAQGLLLTVACTDPDADAANPSFIGGWRVDTQTLLHVKHGGTPALGHFAYSTVPVVQLTQPGPAGGKAASRLVGYVTVAISQADGETRLSRVRLVLVAVCGLVVLLTFPAVSLLVHRIFFPIRQLVDATDRAAAGDLRARVAVHRPDVIGTLARSFNEMVIKVKQQQDALAEANRALAAANDELAGANRGLEAKVNLRTVELEAANRRLSSEIAEKEEFLRAISHDLNAPLRNIAGMASMLLMKHRERFDDDVIHRLERIQKNVEVESDLIGELLELSRIKTRRHKLERVDPARVVAELGDMFENDLRTRDIRLCIDGPLPAIDGERARVRQVFQNLIDNAIKYMGDGPRREIHVGCTHREGEAEFYVADTGIGIEPDDLPKVFQVFRRGKGQAVQGVPGKGVGLASVKSIVETYSGTIWVESEVGRGTTFRFTINGKYLPDTASGRPAEGAGEAEFDAPASDGHEPMPGNNGRRLFANA